MPNPPLRFSPQVPIVGASHVAHEGIVMATFTCRCQSDNAPQVIRGTDLMVFCAKCRNIYAIMNVEFDRARGHVAPLVTVSMVGKVPEQPGQPEVTIAAGAVN